MIYGYARVSTATKGRDGNSLEDQVAALEKYGCQKIVKEAFTGKTMDRPKFLRLLEELQEGDTLVVCKLDRFARTAIGCRFADRCEQCMEQCKTQVPPVKRVGQDHIIQCWLKFEGEEPYNE